MKAKIHINSVIAFAMMFILYEPWYMGEIQTFHQFNIIFRFVMVVLLMFEWIRIGKYDIPYIIFLILAVHVCYLIGSIQQESGITNAVKEFVNVSLKLLFVIYIFRENGKHLNEYIEGMSYYMVILCVLNTISILIPFSGISEYYASRNYFFLGSDNASTPLYFLALFLTYVRHMLAADGKKYGYFVVVLFSFIYFAIYQQVGTAVVSLIIIAIVGVYEMKRKSTGSNLTLYCIGAVVSWLMLFFLRVDFLKEFINKYLFGKFDSISSRIELWLLYLNRLKASPLFGYGIAGSVDEMKYVGITKWVLQHNTHNSFLEVLYNGGIIAFMLFLIALIMCARRFDKNIRNKTSRFLAVLTLAYLIRGLVECSNDFLFFVLPFVYRISTLEKHNVGLD